MSKPTEKCGVVGVTRRADAGPAAAPIYYALHALQHRGQESAGIITHDGFQQHQHVDMGLVGDVFTQDSLDELVGQTGIGHVRYPTSGSVNKNCAQPFSVSFKSGSLGLSHNGNLVNMHEVRDTLAADGHAFTSDGDTEVIAHYLARQLLDTEMTSAVSNLITRVEGSYSLAVMQDDSVFGLRDPKGNRPLILGELDDGYIIASESAAIDAVGGTVIRDIRPGELVQLHSDGSGYETHEIDVAQTPAHCFFEYVYFARPDSKLDGRLVYDVRRRLGRRLWEESPTPNADVVIPVPDSGRAFASGYAEAASESGADIEFAEGLMKNRYVGRTFIMPTQGEREQAVRMKLNPIESTVKNRRVALIDDSIVRGTTSTQLVDLLREAGADSVDVRIGAPPIIAPCYMGIDMSTREELIAAGQSVEEVCEEIGADSLAYLSVEGVADALEMSEHDLCLGCVTGEYPYDIAGEPHREAE